MAESAQPLVQPPLEDIRNAAMIAESWASLPFIRKDPEATRAALRDILKLLKHAIEGLGEPNLASVQAAEILIREWNGSYDVQRNYRDVAAGILHAAVTGETPKTWEVS